MKCRNGEFGALTMSDVTDLKERVRDALLAAGVPAIIVEAVLKDDEELSIVDVLDVALPLSVEELQSSRNPEDSRKIYIAKMGAFDRLATVLKRLESKATDGSQEQNGDKKVDS